jgi:hypothetical protein
MTSEIAAEVTAPDPASLSAANNTDVAVAPQDWGESFYPFSLIMLIITVSFLPAIALFGYVQYLISGNG